MKRDPRLALDRDDVAFSHATDCSDHDQLSHDEQLPQLIGFWTYYTNHLMCLLLYRPKVCIYLGSRYALTFCLRASKHRRTRRKNSKHKTPKNTWSTKMKNLQLQQTNKHIADNLKNSSNKLFHKCSSFSISMPMHCPGSNFDQVRSDCEGYPSGWVRSILVHVLAFQKENQASGFGIQLDCTITPPCQDNFG